MKNDPIMFLEPIKLRPAEPDVAVREARNGRSSRDSRQDFGSTLAATQTRRQGGNERNDNNYRREQNERAERSAHLNESRENEPRRSEAQAERLNDKPVVRERGHNATKDSTLKSGYHDKMDRTSKEHVAKSVSKEISTLVSDIEKGKNSNALKLTLSDLVNELEQEPNQSLSPEQINALIEQLSAALKSLSSNASSMNANSLSGSDLNGLITELESIEVFSSEEVTVNDIASQIAAVLNQFTTIKTAPNAEKDLSNINVQTGANIDEASLNKHSTLSNNYTGNQGVASEVLANYNQSGLQSDTNTGQIKLSNTQLTNGNSEKPLFTNSALLEANTPKGSQNTSANSSLLSGAASSNLTWLNGVLAQAEHVRNNQADASNASSNAPKNNLATQIPAQSLSEMAKFVIDNAQSLNLSADKIAELKAMLAANSANQGSSGNALAKGQVSSQINLSTQAQSGSEANTALANLQLELTSMLKKLMSETSIELPASIQSIVVNSGSASSSLSATSPFVAGQMLNSNAQMANALATDNMSLISSAQLNGSAMNLDGEMSAELGNEKLKLADVTASSLLNSVVTGKPADSDIKPQTVEVQGVQLDRTLQAPKLESISNTRHDAMIRENILFNKQQLATAMQQQVGLMMARNMKSVDIRLDPPELGSMQIRLNIGAEQASVNFVVSSQQAKDALEGSIPKLREMLEQQGMQLTDSNVKKDNSNGQGGQAGEEGNEELNANTLNGHNGGDNELTDAEQASKTLNYQINSPYKVDYYA
jgi:flagellar hook-length control protein FliK